MARPLADIERDIRALSTRRASATAEALISDLDAPADPDAERAWVEDQIGVCEIESGTAKTSPGADVLKEARSRLK